MMTNTDTTKRKGFVKILDDNKEFTIVLKRFLYEDEWELISTYYFQPSFVLSPDGNKIVRKDILWEKEDVTGYNSEGFILANQNDFEEYCKKCFEKFKNSLYLNPFSSTQEPEYSDKEICSLDFNFGYEKQ